MTSAFHRVNLQFDLSSPVGKSQASAIYGALAQNFLNAASQGMTIGLRGEPADDTNLPDERLVFTTEVSSVMPTAISSDERSEHYSLIEAMSVKMWQRALTSQAIDSVPSQPVDHPDYLTESLPKFNKHTYQLMLNDFAAQCRLPSSEAFLRYGDFRYRGHDMRLSYGEHRPDRFQIQIDLGGLPKGWSDDLQVLAFRCLLSANHLGFESSGLVWGLNPLSDHVVLTADYSVWNSEQGLVVLDSDELLGRVQGLLSSCEGFWESILEQATIAGDAVLNSLKEPA